MIPNSYIMTFNLENNLIAIKVEAVGAELVSLKTKNNDLEYIWEADPEVWARHAPVLFPIVGKLKNNTFTFEGKDYHMPQHGFARDKEFELLSQDDRTLSLRLNSDSETIKMYPFPFELITTYALEGNAVVIHHKIKNPENDPIYFSIGAHPGFRCPLNDEDFGDYYLEFEKEEDFVRHKIKDGYLSGSYERVGAEGNKIPLSRMLFKEDALVFEGLQSEYVSIKNHLNDFQVKVSLKGFPYLGIWTKVIDRATFLCIEPWLGIADHYDFEGDFSRKEGVITLGGHQQYSCSYTIAVQ